MEGAEDDVARAGGLQVEFERRVALVVVCDVSASQSPVRRMAESRCLVDGQRVAAAVTDRVDPAAVTGGVDAVGQASAGQRDVGAFGG